MSTSTASATATQKEFLSSAQLLEHWQGHRRLTRRVIELFPEKEFFSYSIGGMRPFAQMVLEFQRMAEPGARGIATREWLSYDQLPHLANQAPATTKAEVLARWDAATEAINEVWPTIPEGRWQEEDVAFGQYPGHFYDFVLYFIDNEIHHRGQAYVYLRSLGIEPPAFWER